MNNQFLQRLIEITPLDLFFALTQSICIMVIMELIARFFEERYHADNSTINLIDNLFATVGVVLFISFALMA